MNCALEWSTGSGVLKKSLRREQKLVSFILYSVIVFSLSLFSFKYIKCLRALRKVGGGLKGWEGLVDQKPYEAEGRLSPGRTVHLHSMIHIKMLN